MGIFNFFRKNTISDKNYEVVVSSSEPYTIGETVNDDDGTVEHKTFTENWEMKTDRMKKFITSPVKVISSDNGALKLEFFLPDETTNKNYRNMHQDQRASLWIYLKNEEFFIIFPEYIDPYLDPNGLITHFRINLCETGFHSELKRLADSYSPQEICQIISEKLTTDDIIEIEPKILDRNGNAPECPIVTINCHTAPTLKKAFSLLRP